MCLQTVAYLLLYLEVVATRRYRAVYDTLHARNIKFLGVCTRLWHFHNIHRVRLGKRCYSYRFTLVRYVVKHRKLAKKEMLRVRLSEYEIAKLNCYAWKQNKTVSLVIREYIKRLPAVRMTFEEFKTYYQGYHSIKIDETKFNISLLKDQVFTLEEWLQSVATVEDTNLHLVLDS